MRAHPSLGPIAATCLLACGLDARDQQAGSAGIDTLMSASDALGTSTGGGGSSSEGGQDDSPPAAESSEGAAGDTGTPNAPKFDIGSVSGGTGEDDCASTADQDADGDGWTPSQGDCNDCDPNANPGAIEVVITQPDDTGMVPDPADEDCDGGVDNVLPPCDGGFALDDSDPISAAAAIGLCKVAEGTDDYGILSASWVRANGAAAVGEELQFGIQDAFGPNVAPLEGDQFLALSSGHARTPGQADSCNSLTCYGSGAGTAPAGFPQDVPACPGSTAINDDIALEVTLRAPTNATGFSYNFDFYSFEYPEWVCTSYNDQYIALVEPAPVGSIDGNISFDSMGNPVSVNIAFFDVCSGCTLGTGELSGTGFDTWDDAGATSWLVTTSPVDGGSEVTIRFAIWDTGDAAWDSTVLIDNFVWIADGADVDVGTEPEG
jgi:hypothetical protein